MDFGKLFVDVQKLLNLGYKKKSSMVWPQSYFLWVRTYVFGSLLLIHDLVQLVLNTLVGLCDSKDLSV